MERKYSFEWYETKTAKYGKPSVRHSLVKVSKPTGQTNVDCKDALQIFMRMNGNLKKNTIIKIKELDENNRQIGEDITPNENSAIIPVAK